MKIKYLILFLLLVVVLVQCAVEQKTTYDIPSYVHAERKAELLSNLEKGRILFKTNCSGCHGIFTKGKDGVPNFTEKEIVNYMTAYQTNDQKNHAVMKKLLPEELSMIMTFLKLRKFKGKPEH
ncbi:MAG: c-type cytochrome [Ferruginibacter sp.]